MLQCMLRLTVLLCVKLCVWDLVSIAHHVNFGCDMQGLNALEVKVGITSENFFVVAFGATVMHQAHEQTYKTTQTPNNIQQC